MKSETPIRYFRDFLREAAAKKTDLETTSLEQQKLKGEAFGANSVRSSVGNGGRTPLSHRAEKYFIIFQLITIYNLMQQRHTRIQTSKKKEEKKLDQREANRSRYDKIVDELRDSQRKMGDVIVEIVRILDKHLEQCFPILIKGPGPGEEAKVPSYREVAKKERRRFEKVFDSLIDVRRRNKTGSSVATFGSVKGEGEGLDGGSSAVELGQDRDKLGASIGDASHAGAQIRAASGNAGQDISRKASSQQDHTLKACFILGHQDYDVMIPLERLDRDEIHHLDLSYYLQQCREILKKIYDNKFKDNKNKSFIELTNYLLQDELEQNLVKQVFFSKAKAGN